MNENDKATVNITITKISFDAAVKRISAHTAQTKMF